MKKLKSSFSKDTNEAVYLAHYKSELFRRPDLTLLMNLKDCMTISYDNIRKYEMELPTGVLAYRLLKSADIVEDK